MTLKQSLYTHTHTRIIHTHTKRDRYIHTYMNGRTDSNILLVCQSVTLDVKADTGFLVKVRGWVASRSG